MVTLKWKGDELFLGATKMAHVMPVAVAGKSGKYDETTHRYVVGPEDHVSDPYQDKDDAKQDCERHVRDLLAKAGA